MTTFPDPHSPLSTHPFASKPWRELDFIGFDTETTGKYPLAAEVCELAAVKWRDGKIVETFSTLLKPKDPMDAEVIAIHGITNAMVENAPQMAEKIEEFHRFIQGGVLVAHHAPFDLAFMSLPLEAAKLELPIAPVLCSSLLSRKLFPESTNHRLQTLIKFFDLPQGAAHRALDDAKACLEVGLRCLEKLGADLPLQAAIEQQGGELTWQRFSTRGFTAPSGEALLNAIRDEKIVEAAYSGGSKPGSRRKLHPIGLVRSLDGDFLVAYDVGEQRSKRYFLDKLTDVTVI